MTAFLANRILLPHLAEFKELYPDLIFDFSYSNDLVDFNASDFHAALRFGDGAWKGLTSILIHNKFVPVCSPNLVEGLELPISAEKIARLLLATT